MKPKLYIHVGRATHFLQWEIPEFKKYFQVVDTPSHDVNLLSFGPDVLEAAAILPARKRFAILFPGFGKNPVHNLPLRVRQRELIEKYFDHIFINPGPLEIAYEGIKHVSTYPFSVDVNKVTVKTYRTTINTLLHVSNNGPQKDWQRSAEIMKKTGLKSEVYPPRNELFLKRVDTANRFKNSLRRSMFLAEKSYLPKGYVSHDAVIKKYQKYDGFVHVAAEIKHKSVLDGKYTASLIEAGLTGSILFWHDTFELGNDLETAFNLSKDTDKAAQEILDIRSSINIQEHSRRTREELLARFNPQSSVLTRVNKIIELSA